MKYKSEVSRAQDIYMYMHTCSYKCHFVVDTVQPEVLAGIIIGSWAPNPQYKYNIGIPYMYMYMYYICTCISSKSHRTLKFFRPRNVTTCFCQLIPVNAALNILPHGKELTDINACIRALYMYGHTLQAYQLCMCMCVSLCRRRPRNLATLKLSPHQMGS